MSDLEFFAKLKPERLTSLEEDFRVWRKEFQEDERLNALKMVGTSNPKSVETTYERFEEEN
jgi:hypothetical protein